MFGEQRPDVYDADQVTKAANEVFQEYQRKTLKRALSGMNIHLVAQIAQKRFKPRDSLLCNLQKLRRLGSTKLLVPTVTKVLALPVLTYPRSGDPTFEMGGKTRRVVLGHHGEPFPGGCIAYHEVEGDEQIKVFCHPDTTLVPIETDGSAPLWRHDDAYLAGKDGSFGILQEGEWKFGFKLYNTDSFLCIGTRIESDGQLYVRDGKICFSSDWTVYATEYAPRTDDNERRVLLEIENDGTEEAYNYFIDVQRDEYVLLELEAGGIVSWWDHRTTQSTRSQVQLFQEIRESIEPLNLPLEMNQLVSSYLLPF